MIGAPVGFPIGSPFPLYLGLYTPPDPNVTKQVPTTPAPATFAN